MITMLLMVTIRYIKPGLRPDGKDIDLDGKGVGNVARDNPWETLHKTRFGHPGSSMPSAIENGLSTDDQVDILTYCQTL